MELRYTEQQKNDYIYGMMLELHSQYKNNNTIYYTFCGTVGEQAILSILSQYCKSYNCKLIIVKYDYHIKTKEVKKYAPAAKVRYFKRKKWQFFDAEEASIKVGSILGIDDDYRIRFEIAQTYYKGEPNV